MFQAAQNTSAFIGFRVILVGISVLVLASTAFADPPRSRRLAAPNSLNVARPATQMGRVAWVTTTAAFRPATPSGRFTPMTTTAPARRITPVTTTAPARRFTPFTTTAPARSQENDASNGPVWDDDVEWRGELSDRERMEDMLEFFYMLRHGQR